MYGKSSSYWWCPPTRGETVFPVSRYRHEISSRPWVNYNTSVTRIISHFLLCSVPNSCKSFGICETSVIRIIQMRKKCHNLDVSHHKSLCFGPMDILFTFCRKWVLGFLLVKKHFFGTVFTWWNFRSKKVSCATPTSNYF